MGAARPGRRSTEPESRRRLTSGTSRHRRPRQPAPGVVLVDDPDGGRPRARPGPLHRARLRRRHQRRVHRADRRRPVRSTLRVWERGAGITEACGTGAAAAACAAHDWGLVGDRRHRAHARRRRPRSCSTARTLTLIGPSVSSSRCHRGAMADLVADDPRSTLTVADSASSAASRGALIERTFRERIVLVGVTVAARTATTTPSVARRAGAARRHRRRRRGRPRRAAPRSRPIPATYVGKGKAEELRELSETVDSRHRRVRRRADARRSSSTSRSCSAARRSTAPR